MTDFGNVTSEQVEKFIPIVYKIIGCKAFPGGLSTEEKYSAGLLGVLVAVENYDPTRGMQLSSWVYANVLYAIYKEGKDQQRHKNSEIPMLYFDQADTNTRDPSRIVEAMDFMAFIASLKKFSSREKRILRQLFENDQRQLEVAKAENLTQGTVSKIRRKVLDRLRKTV